jgi:histidyl-tRNA synthetase
MTKLSTDPYKGVRDFYPEDQFIQNYIFSVWKSASERFGYEEYSASILEPSEIYKEKSGEEIINEQTYTFTDRGEREVTLRPEMTPTVARMVAARRRELGFPLRWYSIPNLFRYEATQRGRLREHWQLNVDLFGVADENADIEMIVLADKIMKSFGAQAEDYEIRLNTNGSDKNSLNIVLEALKSSGINNTKVDDTLKRGQTYYTGVVFEFFDTNPANSRSILGGGRYDNLTELFEDTPLPAVGFGAGDVTMRDFLETHGLLPKYKPSTELGIVLTDISLAEKLSELLASLRTNNVRVAVDWSGRKVGDQIKTADKLKIPYILVFGEDEVKTGEYKIKKLATGEEATLKAKDIPEFIRSHSHNS